jgi:glycosyltransferase involved in cell wall biosynthesis
VPFYDSERYIQACIDSLQNQEGVGGPYELIFVNNRSVDGTAAIVESTAGMIVLNEDTPGAYVARNTGIAKASAPLIAFTDADCTVDANWLRSIQDAMDDPSLGIAVGHFRYPGRASLALRILGAYENAKTEYVLNDCAPSYHFAFANNMAVRASLFEEIGLFKEWRRAADTEFVHRMASRRPDLRVAYNSAMRITHLEFVSARARARRLSVYARGNSKVDTFEELGPSMRSGILFRMLRRSL